MTTTIHAFKRTKPTEVDLFGTLIKFAPNDKGHVVADVTEKRVIERLLSIREGYSVYGAAPLQAEEGEEAPIDTSPYLLTQDDDNGEEVTIDLRTLSLSELEAFCDENEIPLPEHKPKAKVDVKAQATRDAIVAFFKVD